MSDTMVAETAERPSMGAPNPPPIKEPVLAPAAKPKRENKQYTTAFKKKIVERITTGGESATSVAKELGWKSEARLYTWRSQIRPDLKGRYTGPVIPAAQAKPVEPAPVVEAKTIKAPLPEEVLANEALPMVNALAAAHIEIIELQRENQALTRRIQRLLLKNGTLRQVSLLFLAEDEDDEA